MLGLLSASQAQNDEETLRQRAIQSLRMELPDVVITPDSALWVNVGPNMRVSLEGVFAHCQGHDAEGCTHVLAARVEDIVQR